MRERTGTAYEAYGNDSAIDLGKIGATLIKKLWIIILVALLMSSAVYLYSKITYVEHYISSVTLAFTTTKRNIEKEGSGKELEVLAEKTHYTGEDVERYQFLFTSDVMIQKIFYILGGRYTESEIEKSLSVSNIPITGIFAVNVMNTDDDFCKRVIEAAISIFPDYLKSFDTSLGIDVIKAPKAPHVSNANKAGEKALYGFIIGAALVIFTILITEVLSEPVKKTEQACKKRRD